MPFSDCISRLICVYTQSTDMYIYYQSTDAIGKRHLYIHISQLMQSENGILLLFYIFLSHGNEKKKKMKKGGMLCTVHKYLWKNLENTNNILMTKKSRIK